MIPLNDFKKAAGKNKTALMKACETVIDSGWYILGKQVGRFEKEFAAYMNAKFAVGVANGMEALQIALTASGIKAGDEVITTPLSAFATTLAIMNVGAMPVFVDLEETTLNIDPELIEAELTAKTKAVMPVHLYGNPCRLDRILSICHAHNLTLIEDACQAHGGKFHNKTVGNFGSFGCFSFYPTKNLGAVGDGGALITNDESLLAKAQALRDYGQTGKYEHTLLGLNSRLDELQAAILLVQLKVLQENTRRRQKIAGLYEAGIVNPAVTCIQTTPNAESVRHLFVIRTEYRDQLMAHLKKSGVMCAIHYPKGVYQQQAYLASMSGVKPSLPVCEQAVRTIISLPMNPELSDSDVNRVIDAVNAFKPG